MAFPSRRRLSPRPGRLKEIREFANVRELPVCEDKNTSKINELGEIRENRREFAKPRDRRNGGNLEPADKALCHRNRRLPGMVGNWGKRR